MKTKKPTGKPIDKPNDKPIDKTEVLAKKMWQTYVRAQSKDSYYARWEELTDGDTRTGFLAVAAMVLKEGKS